jgi:hypothetical protein
MLVSPAGRAKARCNLVTSARQKRQSKILASAPEQKRKQQGVRTPLMKWRGSSAEFVRLVQDPRLEAAVGERNCAFS